MANFNDINSGKVSKLTLEEASSHFSDIYKDEEEKSRAALTAQDLKSVEKAQANLSVVADRFIKKTGVPLIVSRPTLVTNPKQLDAMVTAINAAPSNRLAIDTEMTRGSRPGTIQISPVDGACSNKTYTIAVNAFRREGNDMSYLRTELNKLFGKDDYHLFFFNAEHDVSSMAQDGFRIPVTNKKGDVTLHDTLKLARSMQSQGVKGDEGDRNRLYDVVYRRLGSAIPKKIQGLFEYHIEAAKSGREGSEFAQAFLDYGATDAIALSKLVDKLYDTAGNVKKEFLTKESFAPSSSPKEVSEKIEKINQSNSLKTMKDALHRPPPGLDTFVEDPLVGSTSLVKEDGRYVVSSRLFSNERENIAAAYKISSDFNPKTVSEAINPILSVEGYRKNILSQNRGLTEQEKAKYDILRANVESHKKKILDTLVDNGVNLWESNELAVSGDYDFNPVAGMRTTGTYAKYRAAGMGYLTESTDANGRQLFNLPSEFWEAANLFGNIHENVQGYDKALNSALYGTASDNPVNLTSEVAEQGVRNSYYRILQDTNLETVKRYMKGFGVPAEAIDANPAKWMRYYNKKMISDWIGLSNISKWWPKKNKIGMSALREIVVSSAGPFKQAKSNVRGFRKSVAYAERDNALRSGEAREILLDMALPELFDMVPGLERFREKRKASTIKYAVESKTANISFNQKEQVAKAASKYHTIDDLIKYGSFMRKKEGDADAASKFSRLISLGVDRKEANDLVRNPLRRDDLMEALQSPVIYAKGAHWTKSARIAVTDSVKNYAKMMYDRRYGYSEEIRTKLESMFDDSGNLVIGGIDKRLRRGKEGDFVTTGWYSATTSTDLFGVMSDKTWRDTEFLNNIPRPSENIYATTKKNDKQVLTKRGTKAYVRDSFDYFNQADLLKNIPNESVATEAATELVNTVNAERQLRSTGRTSELSDAELLKADRIINKLIRNRISPSIVKQGSILEGADELLGALPHEVRNINPGLRSAHFTESGGLVGEMGGYDVIGGRKYSSEMPRMSREQVESVRSGYASNVNKVADVFGGSTGVKSYIDFINGVVKQSGVKPLRDTTTLESLANFVHTHRLEDSQFAASLVSSTDYDNIYKQHFEHPIYSAIAGKFHSIRDPKNAQKYLTFDVMQDMEGGKRTPLTETPFIMNDPDIIQGLIDVGAIPESYGDKKYKISTDELSKVIGDNFPVGGGDWVDAGGITKTTPPRMMKLTGSIESKMASVFFGKMGPRLERMASSNIGSLRGHKSEKELAYIKKLSVGGDRLKIGSPDAREIHVERESFVKPEPVSGYPIHYNYRYPENAGKVSTFENVYPTHSSVSEISTPQGVKRKTLKRYVEDKIPVKKDYYVRYVDDITNILEKSSPYGIGMGERPGVEEGVVNNAWGIIDKYVKTFGPDSDFGDSVFGPNFTRFVRTPGQEGTSMEKTSHDVIVGAIRNVISGREDQASIINSMNKDVTGFEKILTPSSERSSKYEALKPTSVRDLNAGPKSNSVIDWLARAESPSEVYATFGGINPAASKVLMNMVSDAVADVSKSESEREGILGIFDRYRNNENLPVSMQDITDMVSGYKNADIISEKSALEKEKVFGLKKFGNVGVSGTLEDWISDPLITPGDIYGTFKNDNIVEQLMNLRENISSGMSMEDAMADLMENGKLYGDVLEAVGGHYGEMFALEDLYEPGPIPQVRQIRNKPAETTDLLESILPDIKGMEGGKGPRVGFGNFWNRSFKNLKKFGSGTPNIRSVITGDGRAMGPAIVGENGPETSISDDGIIKRHTKGSEFVFFKKPTTVVPDGLLKKYAKGTGNIDPTDFLDIIHNLNVLDLADMSSYDDTLTARGFDKTRTPLPTASTISTFPSLTHVTRTLNNTILRNTPKKRAAIKTPELFGKGGLESLLDMRSLLRSNARDYGYVESDNDEDYENTFVRGFNEKITNISDRTNRGINVYNAVKSGRGVGDIYGESFADITNKHAGALFGGNNPLLTSNDKDNVDLTASPTFTGIISSLNDVVADLRVTGAPASDVDDILSVRDMFSENRYVSPDDSGAASAIIRKFTDDLTTTSPELRMFAQQTRIATEIETRRNSSAYSRGRLEQGYNTEWGRRQSLRKSDFGEKAVRFMRGKSGREVEETLEFNYGATFDKRNGSALQQSITKGMVSFVEETFKPIIGNQWRNLIDVKSGTVFQQGADGKQMTAPETQLGISLRVPTRLVRAAGYSNTEELSDKIRKFGISSKGLTENLGVIQNIQHTSGKGQAPIRRTADNSYMLQTAQTLQGHGRRVTALSMGAMGTYFSVTGIYSAISMGIKTVTESLKDLSSSMKAIAFMDAFGGGILNSTRLMSALNVKQDDFVNGWKKLTALQASLSVFLGAIASKVFMAGENGDMFAKMSNALMDAFTKNPDTINKFVTSMQNLLITATQLVPVFIDMISWLGSMLSWFAQNKAIGTFIIQFTVLAFVAQPLLTIFATMVELLAVLLTLTGYSGPMMHLASRGMYQFATGTATATGSVWALDTAMATLFSTLATGLIVFQAVVMAFNLLTGQKDILAGTPVGMLLGGLNSLSGPAEGYVDGGLIAEGDDTIISAKTGEFVINEDAYKNNKRLVEAINDRKIKGFKRGGLIGHALGGLIGYNDGGEIQNITNESIATKSADTSNFNNRIGILTNVTENNAISSNLTAKTLSDASGGNYLNVKLYGEEGYNSGTRKTSDEDTLGPMDSIRSAIARLMNTPGISTGIQSGLMGGLIAVPALEWLKDWVWPKLPNIKAWLKDWVWPKLPESFREFVRGLKWPAMPEWIKNWKWPELKMPDWVRDAIGARGGQTTGERILEVTRQKPTEMTGRISEIDDVKGKGNEDRARFKWSRRGTGVPEGKNTGVFESTRIWDNGVFETRKFDVKTPESARNLGGTNPVEKGIGLIDWIIDSNKGVGEELYQGKGGAPKITTGEAMKGGAFFGGLIAAIESLFVQEKSIEESAIPIATGAIVGAGAAVAVSRVPLLGSLLAPATRGSFVEMGADVGARSTGGKWVDEVDYEGNVIGGHVEGGSEVAKDIGGMIGATINDAMGGAVTGSMFGPVGAVGGAIVQAGIIGTIQDLFGIAAEGKEKQAAGPTGAHLENQYGAPGSLIATSYNFGADVGSLSRGDKSGLEKDGLFGTPFLAAYDTGQAVKNFGADVGAAFGALSRGDKPGLEKAGLVGTPFLAAYDAGQAVKNADWDSVFKNAALTMETAVIGGISGIFAPGLGATFVAANMQTENALTEAINGAFIALPEMIMGALSGGMEVLGSIGRIIFDMVKSFISNPVGSIVNTVGSVVSTVGNFVGGLIPGAAEGGMITSTGFINAHAGEVIGPIDKVLSGSSTSSSQTINVSIPITIQGNASGDTVQKMKEMLEVMLPKMLKTYNVKDLSM